MKADFVNTASRRDRNAYLQLPVRLSGNDAAWIPLSQSMTAFDLSPRHPFYEHSEAVFITVGETSAPLGRIAVLNNCNFNRFHGTNWAFFTHFECADDPDAANALLDAASAWARQQHLDRLVGPVGLLQTDARGMMIAGHEDMSSFTLPYSPSYYAKLMTDCGMHKHYDYLSGQVNHDFRLNERIESVIDRVSNRADVALCSTGSRRNLRRKGPALFSIYKASGTNAPLYYPITPAEEDVILSRFAKSVCPALVHWLERDGRICGVHMAQPNYLQALLRAGRSRYRRITGFYKQRNKPKEINVSANFLLPSCQGLGLSLLLNQACQNSALERGCEYALIGPVLESNIASLSVLRKTGIDFNIVHRLYEKELP